MYHNIPLELRQLRQWVCWRYEDVPDAKGGMRRTKVPYCPSPYSPQKASIYNPGTWGTFAEACAQASGPTMDGIGLVLTEDDPYTGIDIDDKKENPASDAERVTHIRILESFQSYTERSVGERWHDAAGNERGGYHIIIRGKLNGGRDRGHVGVYSTQRYLTFSGDVVRNAPIGDYQELLVQLVAEMPVSEYHGELDEVEGHLTDGELHEMASTAVNAEKYLRLVNGHATYRDDGDINSPYQSRSEADLALISILAFYTRDNEQVRRMFRYSALGKRQKHQDSDRWINRCLKMVRSKQVPNMTPEQMTSIAEAFTKQFDEQEAPAPAPAPEPAPTPAPAPPPPAPAPITGARTGSPYTLPPGLVGDLAQYFHATAVRPLYEASLAAAIGLVAGIAGRSYNISGTGLNQYLLLLAGTGSGKEGMAKGVSKLISATRQYVPMIDDFIGPGAFASGQALVRTLDSRPCFLSILGEFGLTLKSINDPRAPAPMILLRKVLLDLYGKSGWTDMLQSTAYSDMEKNTKVVQAPNLSILGEATPETFYEGIDLSDIADGLIPRFQIMEYSGKRQPRNRNAGIPPSDALVQAFGSLCSAALTSQHNNMCSTVQLTADALALLDAFDVHCDEHLNNAANGGEAQLWNRGHLKALKLAGLLAVGVNPHAPVVTAELAQWAIHFTQTNTQLLLSRFSKGDVGTGESKQIADAKRIAAEYFKLDEKKLKAYSVGKDVHAQGLIPYRYFVTRLSNLGSFRNDRRGAVSAIKNTLDQMVQMELLSVLSAESAMQKVGARQAHYGLTNAWIAN